MGSLETSTQVGMQVLHPHPDPVVQRHDFRSVRSTWEQWFAGWYESSYSLTADIITSRSAGFPCRCPCSNFQHGRISLMRSIQHRRRSVA
jgi:hypothetical protein